MKIVALDRAITQTNKQTKKQANKCVCITVTQSDG